MASYVSSIALSPQETVREKAFEDKIKRCWTHGYSPQRYRQRQSKECGTACSRL